MLPVRTEDFTYLLVKSVFFSIQFRILSYLGSRGLFGRLLVRSLISVPPDGRSGPEPGLTRLIR